MLRQTKHLDGRKSSQCETGKNGGEIGTKNSSPFSVYFPSAKTTFLDDISYKFTTDEQLTNEVMAYEKER